jgi:hypothetical protein
LEKSKEEPASAVAVEEKIIEDSEPAPMVIEKDNKEEAEPNASDDPAPQVIKNNSKEDKSAPKTEEKPPAVTNEAIND